MIKGQLNILYSPYGQKEGAMMRFILNDNHLEYVRTLWVQLEVVKQEEIDRYLHMNAIGLFEGV